MYYEWRSDICDVTADPYDSGERRQSYYWTEEQQEDVRYQAGKRIVEYNGADYYSCDLEDAIWEEGANIINLWAIATDSTLYELLVKWYGGNIDKLNNNVRNSFVGINNNVEFIYFVSGTGYALMDADLLGGSGDGTTEKEFYDFVQSNV